MTKDTDLWFATKILEYNNLTIIEKNEIVDFIMLWSYFEGTQLKKECNLLKITTYVDNNHKINLEPIISSSFSYFKNRYIINGSFTSYYRGLRVQGRFRTELESILLDTNPSFADKFKCCLMVIYRFRNNLFHGEKWEHVFNDQYDNFYHANKFMKGVIDSI